jgi:hypothetical protein
MRIANETERLPCKESPGIKMNGLTAKGVLKRNNVVHLKRHDDVGAGSLEQKRHILGGDRVIWSGDLSAHKRNRG